MMKRLMISAAFLALSGAALAQSAAPPPAPVATVLEQSPEYRFQIDYQVNAAALAKYLPAGWEANPSASGAAKDCNLRLIFIDRMNIVGADGRVIGKGANRLVYMAIPVKQTGGTATGQMIIGGITENDDISSPLLTKATSVKASRVTSIGAVTEDWDFVAGGERFTLHVKFEPAAANRGGGETRFFDPRDPTKLQIFKTEQATDIARNVTTTPPDRVKEFSYKASGARGGTIASLFDGTEKVLSWDSQRWYVRTISAPAP